jgi:hypothetical protein
MAGNHMLKPQTIFPGVGRASGEPPVPKPRSTEADASESSAHSTALYIAQMTNELARLARFGRLGLLTYLLDMARLEAEICCLRAGPPDFLDGARR